MKTLILTEKPSVSRDFAKALGARTQRDGYLEGKGYIITWALGHLVELFEPQDYDPKWKRWSLDNLPILPQKFQYKPIVATQKQLDVIKGLLKNRDIQQLVIATDAGREGEVIARTILLACELKQPPDIQRFWTSQALTPRVIQEGMAELSPAGRYDRLWRAGQARQIADWLVGMNSSRAASLKMDDLYSVGRVQTAVLALLVDRRREREHFKPAPYWQVRACFSNDKGQWWGLWFRKKESRFDSEEKAKAIQEKVRGKTGEVVSAVKQRKKQPPPPLFSLTDLQQEANRQLGISADQTLKIAQSLYEEKKCLSYPRTEARVLGSKSVNLAREIVKQLTPVYTHAFEGVVPKLIGPANKRVFNDAKLTDHHALIPLAPLPASASPDQAKVYYLVMKRFAAAFHPDCQYEQTEIITEAASERFRTQGKIILEPGWHRVYQTETPAQPAEPSKKEPAEEKKGLPSEESPLPPLVKGDPARAETVRVEKKMTTPPPEYSEALLLKDMTNPARYVSQAELKKIYRGDVGLGTQATRAQTIETLLNRKYIRRHKKRLIATDKGCLLVETLRRFEAARILTSPEETARWERQLERIAQGEQGESDFLKAIREFVAKTVAEFKSRNLTIRPPLGRCPACGGSVIEGKRAYGCANWRESDGACGFVIAKEVQGKLITPILLAKLLSKKRIGPLNRFYDAQGNPFDGFLELKQSQGAWSVAVIRSQKPVEKSLSAKAIGQCPACGGEIVEGNKGFGCANWREENGACRFVIWKTIAQKPISAAIARTLLTRGSSERLEGFRSRKGKPFSARLKLERNGRGLKVGFDFDG